MSDVMEPHLINVWSINYQWYLQCVEHGPCGVAADVEDMHMFVAEHCDQFGTVHVLAFTPVGGRGAV